MKHIFKNRKYFENAEVISKPNLSSEKIKNKTEKGFSIIETTAAMLILLIALLGIFSVFTYAVVYNNANSTRAKSLAILQREAEQIRSAKFTPAIIDSILTGGKKDDKTVSFNPGTDESKFKIQITVDDDPFTEGIQTNSAKTLKEITILVTPQASETGWQASVPAILIIRRVRSN